ncbi:GumC family protein [Aureivirga sp. CE67]|uniref:GumC family protein n=1 Tax=Aureivirga sp. CE67 TaxID=1788983 RepID=UPI0018CB86AE|nr:tyrosine-protein kinase family protein [Aureivirga sp. CE67]
MQDFDNDLFNEGNGFDFKKEIFKFLRHWKWIFLCVIVTVAITSFYLRYATAIYQSSAKILLKDSKGGGLASQLEAFEDLGIASSNSSNLENEIEILKSRSLINSVVEELKLNFIYKSKGSLKSSEIFEAKPIELTYLGNSKLLNNKKEIFNIKITSESTYDLYDVEENKIGEFNFGQRIGSENDFILVSNEEIHKKVGNNYKIVVIPIKNAVNSLKSKIVISKVGKRSSVLSLSIKGENQSKNNAILNSLIDNYNKRAIEDKSKVIKNTAQFIDSRLKLISKELFTVDSDEESFKKNNKLTDLASEATLFLDKVALNEQKYIEISTQLQVIKFMQEALENASQKYSLIPTNLGLEDISINENIATYNTLVNHRTRKLDNATELNPTVIQLTRQLDELKINLKSSLQNLYVTFELQLKAIESERRKIDAKIATVPSKERQFRDIKRTQEIKERLYLYLLEKREENAIQLAIVEPNSKVIDWAYSGGLPIAPKKKIILLAGILLGLIIPIGVIYVLDLLDTKVHDTSDVKAKVKAPILGDVPKSEKVNKYLLDKRDRSSIAEAYRILRTNLDFMLPEKEDGTAKIIFTTSTVSKEGKSFTAIHLASTLSDAGKKVLLIGMDLRAPKIMQYLEISDDKKGVTSFVKDKNSSLDEYIIKAPTKENLYLLPSGFIPPNPAEMLLSPRIKEMFESVKNEYDYVIVDTAPVSLVTDTLAISKYADMFLYVIRAEVLDRKLLEIPQKLYTEKKLPNMAVIVNGVDHEKGYGYGYGYGYGAHLEKKKNIFQKIFKR